ncbi:autotransporter outer membrane beta-barrel domain-containing protein [Roseiconus lacunae]|uniref:hypothetical protein n=1 Tax=Roseiconus lacunae TaxID=2605694 RepID=UPI001E599F8C|nr:hypothetical protein [Roseiconus lacunae]MCD0459118.1 hypothetical protein [Roseiconus lacunae]
MTLSLIERKQLNLQTDVLSQITNGLRIVTEFELPPSVGGGYFFTLLITDLRRESLKNTPSVAETITIRFGDLLSPSEGYSGDVEQTFTLPANAKTIVVRSRSFSVFDTGALEPETLHFGPGPVSGRDDMFFKVVEACLWQSSPDFADTWDEGVTLLANHNPADTDADITSKLNTLIAGVKVSSYATGVAPETPQSLLDMAEAFGWMVTGIGNSSRFTEYAMQHAVNESQIVNDVRTGLTSDHGAGSWTAADLAATNAAIAAIPTSPVLANDPRLDHLDAPVSMPVIVGGYLGGQAPTQGDYTARFDAIDSAVGNIPVNPLLADDARLNLLDAAISTRLPTAFYSPPPTANQINDVLTFSHGSGSWVTGPSSVTVAGYAAGQSPATLLNARFTALDNAVGNIPTNPLATNDSRIDVIATINAAVGNIPTNSLLADDSRLDNYSTFDPATQEVIVGKYRKADTSLGNTSILDTIQSRANQIPINPLLTTDTRITTLVDGVAAVPTDTVLASDPRLDYLDAPISMPVIVGGYVAGESPSVDVSNLQNAIAQIPTNPLSTNDPRLDHLDVAISSRLATGSFVAPDNAGISAARSAAETIRDGRTLAAGDYATLAEQSTTQSMIGSVQAGVSSRIAIITSDTYITPASGSTLYTIVIQSNDATGQPIDLDSDAMPTVAAAAGATDRSANLSSVSKTGTGRYSLTYDAAFDATVPESITLTASGDQSSTTYVADFVVSLTDVSDTDYTASDRTRDDAILAAINAANTAIGALPAFDPSSDTVTVGGYATGQSPADLAPTPDLTPITNAIAAIPTNPLLDDDIRLDEFSTFDPSSDQVQLDLTQEIAAGVTLNDALTNLGSLGSGPFELTVTVKNQADVIVPNIVVDLLDNAANRLGIWGVSDMFGNVTFRVPTNDYQLTIGSTAGYTLAANVSVSVGDDTDQELVITQVSPNLPSAPGMCVVDDYVFDSRLIAVPGAVVTAVVDANATLANTGIATQIQTQAITNADGRFQLSLPRQTQFTAGGIYTITVTSANGSRIYRTVTGRIPDQDSCLLKDIEGAL